GNVEVICSRFLSFIRNKYDRGYKNSRLPKQLREGPEFLAAGFGRDDNFPTLFRILVNENRITQHFDTARIHTGLAWNGQSDAVERFIRGYDSEIRGHVKNVVKERCREY